MPRLAEIWKRKVIRCLPDTYLAKGINGIQTEAFKVLVGEREPPLRYVLLVGRARLNNKSHSVRAGFPIVPPGQDIPRFMMLPRVAREVAVVQIRLESFPSHARRPRSGARGLLLGDPILPPSLMHGEQRAFEFLTCLAIREKDVESMRLLGRHVKSRRELESNRISGTDAELSGAKGCPLEPMNGSIPLLGHGDRNLAYKDRLPFGPESPVNCKSRPEIAVAHL